MTRSFKCLITILLNGICIFQTSSANLFSKQIQCDPKGEEENCREVLAGLIHLNPEENVCTGNYAANISQYAWNTYKLHSGLFQSVELKTFRYKDVLKNRRPDSSSLKDDDVQVTLKIQKSPLLIVYELEYLQDVPGSLTEDIFEYTWSAAGGGDVFHDADFDDKKCLETVSQTANNFTSWPESLEKSDPIRSGGRVCGCSETGWGSSRYSNVLRSQLNCNAWRTETHK